MTMVHRFWIGPPSPDDAWIGQVVRLAHPEAEVVDWALETLPADIRQQMDPDDDPGHLSNIVRHWALHEHGGLWLDHDVIPLRDLTGARKPWTADLRGRREGSVMWFPEPGHPMMAWMLDIALNAPKEGGAPGRSGTWRLRATRSYPDVKYEARVLPIDAAGQRTNTTEIWAVHLWRSTTVRRAARKAV